MAALTVTGRVPATRTIVPLTSIFTPAPDCASRWTYIPQDVVSISRGLLLQNAVPSDTPCYPWGYHNTGRAEASMVLSPGYCPMGYTTAKMEAEAQKTTAICCRSNFTYYTERIQYSNGYQDFFAGCVSNLPQSSNIQASGDTRVTGPVTMWAQPITVMLHSTDMTLYTTPTASPIPVPAAIPIPNTSPTASRAEPTLSKLYSSSQTSTTAEPVPIPTSDAPIPTPPPAQEQPGLSAKAKGGIGAAASVALLAMVALVAYWRVLRIKNSLNESVDSTGMTRRISWSYYIWASCPGPLYDQKGQRVKVVRAGPPAELEA
ncbi:hypothetical protein BDV25DRAFT_135343 [Aspergillus avenaceus]|uniref:Uncharacterized protein n=1 Tax=Aspergillus avenaceus TaxID=36643 RepID=A0A5N6U8U2_ASPAV|nr:hypothetical protein BDV25DRAFT_135343 [Aspergillus avenaceus]